MVLGYKTDGVEVEEHPPYGRVLKALQNFAPGMRHAVPFLPPPPPPPKDDTSSGWVRVERMKVQVGHRVRPRLVVVWLLLTMAWGWVVCGAVFECSEVSRGDRQRSARFQQCCARVPTMVALFGPTCRGYRL